jgi:anti-sigma factor RsiW
MNDCKRVRESLSAWLDSELSASDAEGIRLHLEGCVLCDGERRQLEKLHASLENFWRSGVPQVAFEPFWRKVRERITEKRTWPEAVLERARSTFAAPGLAWAIPAVILVLLGALSLDSLWRPGSQRSNFAAVESIDPYGRNVAVLREDETKTTVIWLYQEGDDESGESTDKNPSF